MTTLQRSSLKIPQAVASESMMKAPELSPTGSNALIKNISFIHHSVHTITSQKNHYYTYHNAPDNLNEDVTLVPSTIDKTNTRDYVFLGSCSMPLLSDMGVTLNPDGDLILIKGQCHNLLSGLYIKNSKKNDYTYYTISKNSDSIAFESLYLDAAGELTAKQKNKDNYYSIRFNTNTSVDTEKETIKSVNVTYKKQHTPLPTDLSFQGYDGNTTHFYFKNNNLYLSAYSVGNKKYDYSLMEYKIEVLSNTKYSIASVKRCRNMLQIEAIKRDKVRIFYIDPKNLSNPLLKTEKASHKPPQGLYTLLGGDTHEKYYCGQPFSSTRWGNFSSLPIPIISPITDAIRLALKKNNAKRSKTEKFLKGIKCADPGINVAISVTKDLLKKTEKKEQSDTSLVNTYIKDLKRDLSPLINDLPAFMPGDDTFAKKIVSLLLSLETSDALTLSKENEFSLFFSILQSGIPFHPGWFASFILSITKTHRLILTRSTTGNIKLVFTRKRKIAKTLLLGTGQGFESTLLSQGGVNFFSIMPFEANALLTLHKTKELDFSFELTPSQLESLFDQSFKMNDQKSFFEKNAILVNKKQTSEYNTALSLDIKINELRAMVSVAPTDNVHLNLPRLACGTGVKASVFTYNKRKETRYSDTAQQPTVAKKSTLKLLSGSGNFFAGEKYIIAPHTINDNGPLCYRLALIESGISTNINTKSVFKHAYTQVRTADSTLSMPKRRHHKQIKKVYSMLAAITETGEIIRPMHKIENVKVTRRLHNPVNLSQSNVLARFRSTSSQPTTFKHVFGKEARPQPFADTLRALADRASSKNRNNLNKKLSHSLVAKYDIKSNDKKRLLEFKHALNVLESNPNALNRHQERKTLKELHHQIAKFKHEVTYQLNTVDLYSVGEMVQTTSSLTNVLLNFRQTNVMALKKHLGQLALEYADTPIPTRITGNYRFF
ncbi:hypothetical protein [Symbiopectobacterium purcellii]|uniref:Uncharacterized protein n=1 Tax=Symbiopectobacterium purcellii TaxID=2871826 RepID=A0ABX9AQI6_9ENTR|nr:hypothetical protein [Symbiopectobacterium purcellii]QZN96291.1 hypothetical protein K6K13_02120 [Symbiopectobacterium purcellii]